MISNTVDTNELSRIWRQMILKQTELQNDRVLNGMSVRGIDLAKRFEDIRMSINLKDCFIVFYVEARQSDNDVGMTEEDGTITSYKSYALMLTVYGELSIELATILKSRLETDKCRNDLYVEGVYFERVSSFDETNEFLNDTVWQRADLTIDFSVRIDAKQIDDFEDFEQINRIEAYH